MLIIFVQVLEVLDIRLETQTHNPTVLLKRQTVDLDKSLMTTKKLEKESSHSIMLIIFVRALL